jgi:formylglycine-generating enzyme required for sulfatase activity
MKIFISYRRAEDNKSYIVGTIHEKIAQVFGKENVFRDTYDISGGSSWREVLDRQVNTCQVMLVVIGPDWANLAYPNGEKRLFDPKDVTRWEVETGLRRSREENTTVIPLLVTGAQLPRAEDLPESLHPLLEKNLIKLRNYPDFDTDIQTLIHDIRLSRGYGEDDISLEYFEPPTIYIAAGPFQMGSLQGEGIPQHETPQHPVDLPAFRIGKYPVTNSQYEEFITQTQTRVMPIMGWEGQRVPQGLEQYPVTGVTWYEALKYCEWLNHVTGREYSLPNEAQWEKACRGGDNCIYPWGDEFDPLRCNHGKPQLAPVDTYPAQNEFQCFDLVGNVRQWTTSLWGHRPIPPDFKYPWTDRDGRNNLGANSQIRRVVRGSSFTDDSQYLRCSARSGQFPENAGLLGNRHGFRVVMKISDR